MSGEAGGRSGGPDAESEVRVVRFGGNGAAESAPAPAPVARLGSIRPPNRGPGQPGEFAETPENLGCQESPRTPEKPVATFDRTPPDRVDPPADQESPPARTARFEGLEAGPTSRPPAVMSINDVAAERADPPRTARLGSRIGRETAADQGLPSVPAGRPPRAGRSQPGGEPDSDGGSHRGAKDTPGRPSRRRRPAQWGGPADTVESPPATSDTRERDPDGPHGNRTDGGPTRRRSAPDGPARRRGPGYPPELDPDADPVAVAREICLRLLTDRARTRTELAQALHRRGVPDEAATTVLERFDEVGLIDDAAFAGQWVRSRHAGRGLARRAIAQELRRKGVADDVAGEALAEVDGESEERRARQLVDRKLRTVPADTAEERVVAARRLVGMLARKGYSGSIAYRVVREALAEHGADVDELGAEPADD